MLQPVPCLTRKRRALAGASGLRRFSHTETPFRHDDSERHPGAVIQILCRGACNANAQCTQHFPFRWLSIAQRGVARLGAFA